MKKFYLTVMCCVLTAVSVHAQSQSLIYYLKNSGKLVSTKDSADYWMIVSPPDTTTNNGLYIVQEYYKNGERKLVSTSKTNDINLKYHGRYILYYPTGKRMRTGTFENGISIGLEMEYYPNGKLYCIKNHEDLKILLEECRDSIGTVMTEKGNGRWIEYDGTFKYVAATGPVKHGKREGEWSGHNTFEDYVTVYRDGFVVSNKTTRRKMTPGEFAPVDTVPQFPGGMEAFLKLMSKNIRYPREARDNRIQGKVVISFVVEKDGTLTDIQVANGIGGGCDEEAMRVVKLSSPWVPGVQNGKPVRVGYSIPISFAMD